MAVVQSEMDPCGWTASTGFLVANPTALFSPIISPRVLSSAIVAGEAGQGLRHAKLGEAIASQAIAEVWPAAGMDQSGSVGRDAHSLCSRRSAKPDPFGCDS
jgi:hypothetical protein